MSARTAVTLTALKILVVQMIAGLVGGKLTFTAYDVTGALRSAHPDLDIPHESADVSTPGVRMLVHDEMEQHVSSGTYITDMKQFSQGADTVSAILYSPAPAIVSLPYPGTKFAITPAGVITADDVTIGIPGLTPVGV